MSDQNKETIADTMANFSEELHQKIINSEITLNQARVSVGLAPIIDQQANEILKKPD